MSSSISSQNADGAVPRFRLSSSSWSSTPAEAATATTEMQLTNILDDLPPGVVDTSVYRSREDVLCDTNETQELPDNFFALYAAPDHSDNAAALPVKRRHCTVNTTSVPPDERELEELSRETKDFVRSSNPFLLGMRNESITGSVSADVDTNGNNGDDENRDYFNNGDYVFDADEGADDCRVDRTADHHAQQSQYVLVEEKEEVEDEEDENAAEDSADADTERTREEKDVDDDSTYATAVFENEQETSRAADLTLVANSELVLTVPSTFIQKQEKATASSHPDAVQRSNQTSVTPATSAVGISLLSLPVNSFTQSSGNVVFWPFAHPPPPSALPLPTQTRAAFHTKRYGAFIKAYLGLSDAEVRQAERRGRSICMIGVRKVVKYKQGTASSPISYSFSSPRQMPVCKGISNSDTRHPFRSIRPSNAESVRTQRVFLRHSVLAVEGDAVFCQLIDRAETLYAVEQQRIDTAAAEKRSKDQNYLRGVKEEGLKDAAVSKHQHEKVAEPVMYPQFRRLPRVSEPYLRPNARCIALHYGLPDSPSASRPPSGSVEAHVNPGVAENRFPRATLIAVVSTTRLDKDAEIYVSVDSYYRCLDEVGWYRRCYSHLNARYGCRVFLNSVVDSSGTSNPPWLAGDGTDVRESPDSVTLSAPPTTSSFGDVYTGVKHFPAWPAGLAYYHGVGKRHASTTAQGAFPFTLVDLGAAPELGEGQKGVVASSWIPYGTCLLYCGPSVATRKIERLVTARVLRGGHASPRDTVKSAGDTSNNNLAEGDGEGEGQINSVEGEIVPRMEAEGTNRSMGNREEDEEEDLSFVTDDTYALGLGRHGVCFGQGLTRYINHRYNTSRFGNVELCSVMLSVPSEFSAEAEGSDFTKPHSSPIRQQQQQQQQEFRKSSNNPPSDPSLTKYENCQIRTIVKKHCGRGSRGNTGTSHVSGTATTTIAVSARPRGKRKAPSSSWLSSRRAPRFFLEEKSFFVTVPFFLVTTDIAPGVPLLAWTYGEDYDAKLERQVVADGHIVPYADAVVLNRRLAHPLESGGRHFQRYNGDYRFAVGVGDVVWRRRPLKRSPLQHQFLLPTNLMCGCCCGCTSNGVSTSGEGVSKGSRHSCKWVEQLVPLPEEDLFVVVQVQRGSVEQVLLQPLTRINLTDAELSLLLVEQHLSDYISPHASFVAVNTALADGEGWQQRPRRQEGNLRKQSTTRRQQYTPAWSQHWAVFQLPPASTLPIDPSTLPLARAEDALRRCVVATVESVGLLLPDIDYSIVQTQREDHFNYRGCGVRRQTKQKGGALRPVLDLSRRIVVNVDDLHHATHLVRTAADRATALPALWNGLMWPLMSAPLEREGGGAVNVNSGNRLHPVPRK